MSQHLLDVSGLLCPLPVIRTQAKITELDAGDILEVICTDPGAKEDIPTWCRIHGHEVMQIGEQDRLIRFQIRISNG